MEKFIMASSNKTRGTVMVLAHTKMAIAMKENGSRTQLMVRAKSVFKEALSTKVASIKVK